MNTEDDTIADEFDEQRKGDRDPREWAQVSEDGWRKKKLPGAEVCNRFNFLFCG